MLETYIIFSFVNTAGLMLADWIKTDFTKASEQSWIKSTVSGLPTEFFGSRLDSFYGNIKNKIREAFPRLLPDDKKNLNKTIRKAQLRATRFVCEAYKFEIKDENTKKYNLQKLKTVEDYLKNEEKNLSRSDYKLPEFTTAELKKMLGSDFDNIEQSFLKIRKEIKKSVFAELSSGRALPQRFQDMILNGWTEDEKNRDWVDTFNGFLAEELQANPEVAAILETKLLKDMTVTLDGLVAINTEQTSAIKALMKKLDERADKLDDIGFRVLRLVKGNLEINFLEKNLITKFEQISNNISTEIRILNEKQDKAQEGIDKVYNRVNEGFKGVENLLRTQPQLQFEKKESIIHTLPLNFTIEGREEECEILFKVIREDVEHHAFVFTAPGGFGKTALLTKFVKDKITSEQDGERQIKEPTIQAFWHVDCRKGITLAELFSESERFISIPEELRSSTVHDIPQFLNNLSALHSQKRFWIAFDNFESLLDKKANFKDREIEQFFNACCSGDHRVRLLVVSRQLPKVTPHLSEKVRHLSDIGKMLFNGLPLEDSVTYLENHHPQGKNAESREFLEKFARRVHRIPMALVWAKHFLAEREMTFEEILLNDDFFEDFDKFQNEDNEDYLKRGLKRLHREQLELYRESEALPILRLLAFFNEFVPQAAFEPLLPLSKLKLMLTRLTKNSLVTKIEDQNFHAQRARNDSEKLFYALHPIICENTFFKELPPETFPINLNLADHYQREAANAYEKRYYLRSVLLQGLSKFIYQAFVQYYRKLFEENQSTEFRDRYLGTQFLLAKTSMDRGMSLSQLGRFLEAINENGITVEIYNDLVKNEKRDEFAEELADAYLQLGESLRQVMHYEDAIKIYDKAIKEYKKLIEKEETPQIAGNLAGSYMSKASALAQTSRSMEAIKLYNEAINRYEQLLNENEDIPLAVNLATAYMNKGNAFHLLSQLKKALHEYEKAAKIWEEITIDNTFAELPKVYANIGVTLHRLGQVEESLKEIDKAVNIYEMLVENDKQTGLLADLAWAYLTRGNTFYSLYRFDEASEQFEKSINLYIEMLPVDNNIKLFKEFADVCISKGKLMKDQKLIEEALEICSIGVNIYKSLIETFGRNELSVYLAISFTNLGAILTEAHQFDKAIEKYNKAVEIFERTVEKDGLLEFNAELGIAYRSKAKALANFLPLVEAITVCDKSISIFKKLIDEDGREELANDLAESYIVKAEILRKEPKLDADEILHNFQNGVEIKQRCIFIEGKKYLLPELIKSYRFRLDFQLELNRWADAAEEIAQAFKLYSFGQENTFHKALKQVIKKEFDELCSLLCQISIKERENIYVALGEKSELVKQIVEASGKPQTNLTKGL